MVRDMAPPAAILDVDGTLVDNNYQHALAWHLALRDAGVVVPVWRIHRAVGIGGDKIVAEVAGREVEDRHGDEVRERQGELFGSMIDEVVAIEGATELIRELKDRGSTVVLASSGDAEDVERFIDLLEIRELVDGWTTSDDVDSTKPDPDLIEVALEKAGGGGAVMVGDTTWDLIAAERAGIDGDRGTQRRVPGERAARRRRGRDLRLGRGAAPRPRRLRRRWPPAAAT